MRKREIKKIALERIRILLNRAKIDKKRSTRYVELARRIAEKCRVKIPKEFKIRICRKCNTFLIPGFNCRVRIKKSRVIITCLNCGKIKRYPLVREIKLRRLLSKNILKLKKELKFDVKKISKDYYEIALDKLKIKIILKE